MKNLPILLVLSVAAGLAPWPPAASPAVRPAPPDRLRILFWNLENFFDWRDDSLNVHPSEAEFSSFGARHWTRTRFQAKCDAIAKSLLQVADEADGLPDIVAVAEVENLFVLRRLLSTTLLYKYDYVPVHFDAPDPRGIDVALLYRSRRFRLLRAAPLAVRPPPGRRILSCRSSRRGRRPTARRPGRKIVNEDNFRVLFRQDYRIVRIHRIS